MSLYAVVDPATGDVVKEYPTATDGQIEQALASLNEAARRRSSAADKPPAAPAETTGQSAALLSQ